MEHQRNLFGFCLVSFSWLFNSLSPSLIPIILSSLASILAAINYWDQIRERRDKKSDTEEKK